MLVELRSWQLKLGALPKFETMMEAATEATAVKPVGVWRTEVGVLNRVISLWPFESGADREAARADMQSTDSRWWDADELILEEDTRLLAPAPFSPPLKAGDDGPVYEVRTYNYRPGGLSDILEGWGAIIDERAKLSRFIGAWYGIAGPLNCWVHIWAYKSVGEREQVRSEAVAKGVWPPKNKPGTFVRQETLLAMPLRCSSLR